MLDGGLAPADLPPGRSEVYIDIKLSQFPLEVKRKNYIILHPCGSNILDVIHKAAV